MSCRKKNIWALSRVSCTTEDCFLLKISSKIDQTISPSLSHRCSPTSFPYVSQNHAVHSIEWRRVQQILQYATVRHYKWMSFSLATLVIKLKETPVLWPGLKIEVKFNAHIENLSFTSLYVYFCVEAYFKNMCI